MSQLSPLRKKIILGLIVGYIILMSAYAYHAHRQKSALESATFAYLESQGVETDTEIDNWFIGNGGGRQDFYVMYVTFEVNPESTSLYTYDENEETIFLLDTIESQAD